MSFVSEFNSLPIEALRQRSIAASRTEAEQALGRSQVGLADFSLLISPAASEFLETLCLRSQQLTQRRFGKVIRFFAPLYLSNECVNNCAYCGFSRDNPIARVTLSVEEVLREARALKQQGFRNILLVSGEHPKFVSNDYLAQCVRMVHKEFPSVSLEIGPLKTEEYRDLVQAGADGLVIYQETYDRNTYSAMHTSGPKRDFEWRIETPERAYAAGFRRLGISALYGLADWRSEALSVAAHAEYLLRNCWKSQITISLPRLRPCAGQFQPLTQMSDRDLVQLVCAFRLMFPDVGIVLSTRESAKLRNGLFRVGITLTSAGSHTDPGGYTGAGKEKLHQTVRGKVVELASGASEWATPQAATGQFSIADERSADEVAEFIRNLGYEPVWKDWDAALSESCTEKERTFA